MRKQGAGILEQGYGSREQRGSSSQWYLDM